MFFRVDLVGMAEQAEAERPKHRSEPQEPIVSEKIAESSKEAFRRMNQIVLWRAERLLSEIEFDRMKTGLLKMYAHLLLPSIPAFFFHLFLPSSFLYFNQSFPLQYNWCWHV